MTSESSYSRVGPKGQVVISKRLRKKYAIEPGKQVEQIEADGGVLIKPFDLINDWNLISAKVGKKWPKKVTSAQAIREDRDKS